LPFRINGRTSIVQLPSQPAIAASDLPTACFALITNPSRLHRQGSNGCVRRYRPEQRAVDRHLCRMCDCISFSSRCIKRHRLSAAYPGAEIVIVNIMRKAEASQTGRASGTAQSSAIGRLHSFPLLLGTFRSIVNLGRGGWPWSQLSSIQLRCPGPCIWDREVGRPPRPEKP